MKLRQIRENLEKQGYYDPKWKDKLILEFARSYQEFKKGRL